MGRSTTGRAALARKRSEMTDDELADVIAASGYHPSRFFPEDWDKLVPEEGGWIRVLDPPHTELSARFEVEPLSMWYAMPWLGRPFFGTERCEFHAVIRTPEGDLHLLPEEYQLVEDMSPWVGKEPDCVMHRLDGEAVVDEERLFYLMSRGIPRDEACLMLINLVRSQEFVYFTMDPFYQEFFAGVGTSLDRHMALNPRRADVQEG
jgi:hypothetical protein